MASPAEPALEETADQPIAEPLALALALDMILIDTDPVLSSGATITRGVLRVGDEVEYLSETGKRVEGRVIEITLNLPNGESSNVDQAKAGDEVFVVFELPATGLAANGAGLTALGSVPDYAALKAITDAARKPSPKPSRNTRLAGARRITNTTAARPRCAIRTWH